MAFRGTFDYTLDAKNRLTVPAKFRASLAGGVVLSKGTEQCIAIWTPEGFDGYVDAALTDLHPISDEVDRIERYFQANSVDTELDSAGRIGIPAFLGDYAVLKKDVTVIGTRRCIEVWDRAAWAAYNEQLDIKQIRAGVQRVAS
jgi:MraZ protein